MDVKVEIKEEPGFLNFCSQNEENLETKVKIETVASCCDCDVVIKTEIEEAAPLDFNASSYNEGDMFSEHPVMKFNKDIKDSETETKIEMTEQGLLGRTSTQTPAVYDDIEDGTDEDFYFIKSPSINKDACSYTSDLFYKEDIRNVTSFSMRNDTPERESAKTCQSQERYVTEISSIETPNDEQIVGMPSCWKQNDLFEQMNKNKQDIHLENCKSILVCDYNKVYKCDVCEKSFENWSHLKTHRLVHESKEANKCDICDKTFTRSQHLKKHKLIHDGIKPYKCDMCDKAFTYLDHLKRHKLIHEGLKPHKCNFCNKAFTDSSSLKRHELIHQGIKPHLCNICNKAFTQISNLKKHNLIHEGIKPHRCNICNKAFTALQHLKMHTLIHKGIKPHKCDICEKSFTDISKLKRHKWIHETYKPYKCNICNKAFTRMEYLKRHKLIHEGIKPHKCDVCNKTFTDISKLKRHKLIHEDKNSQ